jgi:hypothetical protein
MQWMSDMEARMAQLAAKNTALEKQIKEQPAPSELLAAIAAQLTRMDQSLREDFTGKFAGHITPFIDSVSNRVKALDERLAKTEEREQGIEEQVAAHQATISTQLEETEKRQADILNWFVDALNQHHKINAATLSKQQLAVEECRRATVETTRAAKLCTTFANNYEATASHATGAIQTLAASSRGEIQTFVQSIKNETKAAIMPTIKQAREMTEAQWTRRVWWTTAGVMVVLICCIGLTWLAQPSPYIMRDAANWRAIESDMTPEQADTINKVLNEVQAKQRAREEKSK